MKNIKLITEQTCFKESMFTIEDFQAVPTLVFNVFEQEFLNTSTLFFVVISELSISPMKLIKGNNNTSMKKYYCVSDEFYIIAEEGDFGFKSGLVVYQCQVIETDSEYRLTINVFSDVEKTDRVLAEYGKSEYKIADIMNEEIGNHINARVFCGADVTSIIKAYEETEFVHMPDKGYYKVKVTLNHKGLFDMPYNNEFKSMLTDSNAITNIRKDYYLYRIPSDINNYAEVVQVESFAHDHYANFYAIVKRIFCYPQDSGKIKEQFPDFFEKICCSTSIRAKKEMLLRAKEIPYMCESYKLGDKVIYQELNAESKEFGVERGLFQFTVGANNYDYFGHFHNSTAGVLRIADGMRFCSLLEIDNKFKLLFYSYDCIVRYKDKYYGMFKYIEESDFFDSLNNKYSAIRTHANALESARYLMFRGIIKPLKVAKEDFNDRNIKESAPVSVFPTMNQ